MVVTKNSRKPCRDFITSITITFSPKTNLKTQKKINVISKRSTKITTKEGDEQIQIFFSDGTSLTVGSDKERCRGKNTFKSMLGCKNFEDLINYFVICLWYD